jgi:hypothetical protein
VRAAGSVFGRRVTAGGTGPGAAEGRCPLRPGTSSGRRRPARPRAARRRRRPRPRRAVPAERRVEDALVHRGEGHREVARRRPGGRRTPRALGLDGRRRELHPGLEDPCPQLAHLGARGAGLRPGEGQRPVGAERLVVGGDRPLPALPRAGRRLSEGRAHRRVRLGHDAVEQGEQDGVLRREVEVEGGPGDPRAACEVVDGDRAQRALGQQPLGRGQDRQLAVVAGGPDRPATAHGARTVARGNGHEASVLSVIIGISTSC